MLTRSRIIRVAAFVSLGLFILSYSARANAEPPFYQDKTLTVLEGRRPGVREA